MEPKIYGCKCTLFYTDMIIASGMNFSSRLKSALMWFEFQEWRPIIRANGNLKELMLCIGPWVMPASSLAGGEGPSASAEASLSCQPWPKSAYEQNEGLPGQLRKVVPWRWNSTCKMEPCLSPPSGQQSDALSLPVSQTASTANRNVCVNRVAITHKDQCSRCQTVLLLEENKAFI